MAIEYNFTLDMDRSRRDNNIAYARTGDMDSIVINADLVFGGAAYTPSGENAFFECITPNGCSIRSAAEKTGSSVTVEVPPAAFQAAGVINVAYFRFESGEAGNPTYVESTEPFAIVVREGIGDSIDAGDYIEDWRKLVDHLEVVVADVGQKAEQVEIAKVAAEKAKADAETAGTAAANSASEAKSSATAAQQSATAAASSAASVADKFISSAQATTLEPGSQATASVENQVLTIGVPKGEKGDKGEAGPQGPKGDTGVPDGGTPGQLLSKTDLGTAWVDPPSTGNVVTGTSTGLVAHGEDVYAQKPIEVRVKGRTVKNLWPNKDYDYDGSSLSATFNEDGALVVSINSYSSNVWQYAVLNYTGKKNVNYSLFVDKPFTGFKITVESKFDGSTAWEDFLVLNSGETIDTNHDHRSFSSSFRIMFRVDKQTTIENETFKIMFVEGDELQGLILRPGLNSVQPKNLVTNGKNLINTDGASVLEDNFGVRLPNVTLQPGTYVVKRPSGLTGNFAIYREGDTSSAVSNISEAGISFTLTSPIHGLDFRSSDAGKITLDNISQFQLELGSTATDYESPKVTETVLPSGLELRGVPNGVCDELVIENDGTARVERKVYKVVVNELSSPSFYDATHGGKYFIATLESNFEYSLASKEHSNQLCDRLSIGSASQTKDKVYLDVFPFGDDTFLRMWGSIDGVENVTELNDFLSKGSLTILVGLNGIPTEQLSSVVMPALPAPTFNQYHDSDVPSDTSTEYAKDIKVVFNELEDRVAALEAAIADTTTSDS